MLGTHLRNANNTMEEWNEFYFGRKSERKKFINQKSISIAIIIFVVFYSVLFAFVLSLLDTTLWKDTGKYVSDLPGIMITTFITLITFLGVIAKWNKKTYITYSIDDIINKYSTIQKIRYMLILVVLSYIIYFVSPIIKNIGYTNVYISLRILIVFYFIIYLGILARIVWVFLDILFNNNIEHKMLDELYQEFWYSSIRKLKIEWETIEIEEILDYLFIKYNVASKKINFDKIKNISFDTNLDYNKKSYKKLRCRSTLLLCAFIFILSTLTSAQALINTPEYIVQYFVIEFMFIMIIFGISVKFLGLSTTFIGIVYDRKGYNIELSNFIIKNRYTSELKIFANDKYIRFIKCCKNLIALFRLSLESDQTMIVKKIFNCCLQHYDKKNFVLILMLMDYYWYIKMHNHLWDNKQFNQDTIEKYIPLAQAIISDIDRDIKDGKLNNNVFNEYISSLINYESRNNVFRSKAYLVTVSVKE
jgi:hypothetical protein